MLAQMILFNFLNASLFLLIGELGTLKRANQQVLSQFDIMQEAQTVQLFFLKHTL